MPIIPGRKYIRRYSSAGYIQTYTGLSSNSIRNDATRIVLHFPPPIQSSFDYWFAELSPLDEIRLWSDKVDALCARSSVG